MVVPFNQHLSKSTNFTLAQNGQDSRATEKEWLSNEGGELRWPPLFQRHDGHAIPPFRPLTGAE